MKRNIVRCTGLHKRYPLHASASVGEELNVLKGVDLDLSEGSFSSIVGVSGCGKSTLLNLLGLLDTPNQGEIEIDGVSITANSTTKAQLCYYRSRKIGFVFQSHHLLPELTILQNVMIPLIIQNQKRHAACIMAKECIGMLFKEDEIASGIMDRTPDSVSGGQCQRAAIARAIVASPSLIVADEPKGNLDENTANEVFTILLQIQKKRNATIIMVTHNPDQASRTDVVYRLHNGLLSRESNLCSPP